jgi:RNA polymerase nonessential primary-like sigma factor
MNQDSDILEEEEVLEEEVAEDAAAEAETEEAAERQSVTEEVADVTQIYLNDIGNNALLTPAQELELARRVVTGDFDARQK